MSVAQETPMTIIQVQLSTISGVPYGWSYHVAVVVLPLYAILCEAKGRLQGSVKSQ